MKVCLGIASILLYSASLRADCVGYLLRDQVKRQDVDVVLSGRVTAIREVQQDPVVQQVTLRVDRVWKGNVSEIFQVFNVPTDWTKTVVVLTPNGGSVSGGPRGYRPFQPNQSYVVVARRLTTIERSQLDISQYAESYGTAYCRDGSRTIEEAEINHEFQHIGQGRAIQ
jgi:hypothetical protein